MATLQGLFEPKLRNHRNFLLENKRDVKIKSSSNSQKFKPGISQSQKKISASTIQSRCPKVCSQIPTSREILKQSTNVSNGSELPQRIKKGSSTECCQPSHVPKLEGSQGSCALQSASSTRTMNYIHQENTPFEWTEVCPSLISHNICHQGVQTEEIEHEKMYRRLQSPNMEGLVGKESETKVPDRSNLSDFSNAINIPYQNQIPDHIALSGDCKFKESVDRSNVSNTVSKLSHVNNFQYKDVESDVSEKGTVYEKDFNRQNVLDLQKPNNNFSEGNPSHFITDFENLKVSSRKTPTNSKPSSNPTLAPSSYKKGVVPRYLSKRKTEQALASARARDLDPNCPPGHVVMPENERRDTLDTILKNYNELIRELNKMPVRTDTLKMKQRKIEIEKQLDKFEEGIRVFSRSKVYIKLNT